MADVVGYDPDKFEWDTIHEEAGDQIVLEDIGDTYVGEYLGSEEITFTDKATGEEKTFTQLRFRDPQGPKVINAGYELRQIYDKIPPHTVTRTMLANKVSMGPGKSPMHSHRVDVAKSANRTKS
jgi:hypothetical protein